MKNDFFKLLCGVGCGLLLPVLFVALYLYRIQLDGAAVLRTVQSLWGSPLFGKLLLLGLMPDLALVFVLYKCDQFRFGAGVVLGMLPFLILGVFHM